MPLSRCQLTPTLNLAPLCCPLCPIPFTPPLPFPILLNVFRCCLTHAFSCSAAIHLPIMNTHPNPPEPRGQREALPLRRPAQHVSIQDWHFPIKPLRNSNAFILRDISHKNCCKSMVPLSSASTCGALLSEHYVACTQPTASENCQSPPHPLALGAPR